MNNKEFLDGQETRTAMTTNSEKIRIDEKDVSNGRMGIRKRLASLTCDDLDSRLEVLDDLNFEDPGVTTELLNVICEQYDNANKTLKPLLYLARSVDKSKSRRHEKLVAQVVRNNNIRYVMVY